MHEVSKLKKKFECGICGEAFEQEANLKNHKKLCKEGGGIVDGRRICELCGGSVAPSYFARHRKKCRGEREEVEAAPRVYKAARKPCPDCGKVMAATNIRRHQKEACPGGGANP